MDCSLPGTSIHGISQARILEWVAMSFCRRSSWPGDWIRISCIAGGLCTTEPPGVGRWQPERPAHVLPALGMPGDLLHWTLLVTLSCPAQVPLLSPDFSRTLFLPLQSPHSSSIISLKTSGTGNCLWELVCLHPRILPVRTKVVMISVFPVSTVRSKFEITSLPAW